MKRRGAFHTRLAMTHDALMLYSGPGEQGWRKNEQDGDEGGDKCVIHRLYLREHVDV